MGGKTGRGGGLFLEGERVFLRRLGATDCGERYLSWLNDPEVGRFSQRAGRTFSIGDVRSYVRKMNSPKSGHILLGIFWRENRLHVGNVLLGPIDTRNGTAEIANMIGDKAYWGKGVAVDADKELIHYAFSKLGLRKITIGNIAPNRGASFMSYQLGFKLEGTLREQTLWENSYVDVFRFGLMKNEFYARFPQFAE